MKTINYLIFAITLLILGGCCDPEKECDPTCGAKQHCEDGTCVCPDNQYLLGNSCVDKCEDCYIGSLDCGCFNQFIFDISKFDTPHPQVTLHYLDQGNYPSKAGTNVRRLNGTYTFFVPRYCDIDGKRATDIEFITRKIDGDRLEVTARYLKLPSNDALATCTAVFTK